MICVLGDAHVDLVVRVDQPLTPDTDTPVLTSLGPGGQAANVAAWVAELGGRSRLITARATDMAGQLVAAELAARGVEVVGPVVAGRTGVVVSLTDHGTRRSMLTDRGVGPRIDATSVDPSWLDGCSWLHLSAYALLGQPAQGAALAAAAAAASRSARLSVDLSSTAAIKEYGVREFRDVLTRIGPDVLFGDRSEADLVGDLAGAELIMKLGAGGVIAGGRHYPAAPATAADSTGAGDAFAAGYLLGGIELGLTAAARAVATFGAMPGAALPGAMP
jgi:sugar/nucleoside kinase (ribokinase family)